jgi:hypothetical protein
MCQESVSENLPRVEIVVLVCKLYSLPKYLKNIALLRFTYSLDPEDVVLAS